MARPSSAALAARSSPRPSAARSRWTTLSPSPAPTSSVIRPLLEANRGSGQLAVGRLCRRSSRSATMPPPICCSPDRRAGGLTRFMPPRTATRHPARPIETELNSNLPGDPRDTTSPARDGGPDADPAARRCAPARLARPADRLDGGRDAPGCNACAPASRPAGGSATRPAPAPTAPHNDVAIAWPPGRAPDPDRLLHRAAAAPTGRPATPSTPRSPARSPRPSSEPCQKRFAPPYGARELGGRRSRQPGQIRKEAAVTSSSAGSFRLPPLGTFTRDCLHFHVRRAGACT